MGINFYGEVVMPPADPPRQKNRLVIHRPVKILSFATLATDRTGERGWRTHLRLLVLMSVN